MKIADLGERGLIERIERLAQRQLGRRVAIGIGDDAAVLRPRRGRELVVSTDAFVDGVHFRAARDPAALVGRRALVANLSDLAAMGADPLGFTLSLALPASADARYVLDAVRAQIVLGARHELPLVGGNVTRARDVAFHVTVLGDCPRGSALRRDRARPRDRVCVTGTLGRSALDRLLAERTRAGRRYVPPVRLEVAARLRSLRGIGACIDLSDGLLSDLARVCERSGVGARLDVPRVPRPRGFEAACRELRRSPEALLLEGGEDYELLFTLRASAPSGSALRRALGAPVREIGSLTAEPGIELAGTRWKPSGGFAHFGGRARSGRSASR